MLNVNVAELNNDLNGLLSKVRAGFEILLHDHNRPIARLVPVDYSQDFDEELLALAAAGKARLPEEPLPESIWEMPAPEVELSKIVVALRADRDEKPRHHSFVCADKKLSEAAEKMGFDLIFLT